MSPSKITVPDGFSPEERQQRATALFKQGYNCSQSVVLTFSDLLPLDEETLATLAGGFGGGVGHMREVCGTVCGMTILAGFIRPATDLSDIAAAKSANYELVQKFAASFREANGSIICRELLSGVRTSGAEATRAEERTSEYYRKRPCAGLCGLAARIVADYLATNQ